MSKLSGNFNHFNEKEAWSAKVFWRAADGSFEQNPELRRVASSAWMGSMVSQCGKICAVVVCARLERCS